MAFATTVPPSPYGALQQGFGPASSATGLTNLSGVIAPGYGQQGLSAANILGGYSGYGNQFGAASPFAQFGAPNAGYRPAGSIPPVSGPTGFNASGLSSWSGYSAGTVTLAPSASGYGYGAGYQYSGPGGFGGTALRNPIAGGPIFPQQQFGGGYQSVYNGGFGGSVYPTAVADTVIPPTAVQRVAPPPPTIAPVGYE